MHTLEQSRTEINKHTVYCTYFMRTVREIKTSNIHSCLQHLLEFGDRTRGGA